MENRKALVECESAEKIQEIWQGITAFSNENSFKFEVVGSVGKKEALEVFTSNEGKFDLVLTEITRDEVDEKVSSLSRFLSDFEKRTSGILSLQFAYQIKEISPFANIVIAADLKSFDDGEFSGIMTKASQLGVETFLPIPCGDFSLLNEMLESIRSKIIYEDKALKPILELEETMIIGVGD